MTIEEAIKHAEEVAEDNERNAGWFYDKERSCYKKKYIKYAAEHRQLAEWLRDYKRLKEQEPCEDCISREAARDLMYHKQEPLNEYDLDTLPSVTPQPKTGRCKDCKWWKDSDGVYRRGVRAESKCPINNVSVNHGFGYCYMFELQERSGEE